jgi:hypothetical protein
VQGVNSYFIVKFIAANIEKAGSALKAGPGALEEGMNCTVVLFFPFFLGEGW